MPSSPLTYQCLGGALEIGANCHVLSDGEQSLMLDAGMHPKLDGFDGLPDLDALVGPAPRALVLTHCHHDHLGSLPAVLDRFRKTRVLLCHANRQLAHRMLRNALSIQRRRLRKIAG